MNGVGAGEAARMTGEVEAALFGVGSAVRAEARRRNLVPEIQARLAALDIVRARSRARWRLVAAGALACAGGLAGVVLVQRARPLSYAITGVPGPVGSALVAPATRPLDLKFSDGSAVTVPPRAQARVDELDARGAVVAVEEGTLEVSVVHRPRTRWQVHAGGYTIRVTGTRFAAGWDARAQVLTVSMHEGAVLVTGPGLRDPVRVVTGQRLRASLSGVELGFESSPTIAAREEMPELATPRAPSAADAPDLEPVPAAPAETPPLPDRVRAPGRARRVALASSHPVTSSADWRTAAARAEYREALAAAILSGWRDECAQLGADDLVLLGDVARLAGDLSRAEQAYGSARRRFPSSDRPIFALGLIAFEGRHNYRAAGDSFASYLRSFPRGPLAREAAGRLIEARLKAGDAEAAKLAAVGYLRSYPDGPHAALARRTVDP